MPTEPKLTAELSNVETLLKQYSPTASNIDRDTLMYQAGFTAGEVSARQATHWFWPATTAALAASLIMFIVFPTANLIQQTSIQSEHSPGPIADPRIPDAEPIVVRVVRVSRKGKESMAPMLIMRERALRGDFGERRVDAELDAWPKSDGLRPGAFTNRQLLREYLVALPDPA